MRKQFIQLFVAIIVLTTSSYAACQINLPGYGGYTGACSQSGCSPTSVSCSGQAPTATYFGPVFGGGGGYGYCTIQQPTCPGTTQCSGGSCVALTCQPCKVAANNNCNTDAPNGVSCIYGTGVCSAGVCNISSSFSSAQTFQPCVNQQGICEGSKTPGAASSCGAVEYGSNYQATEDLCDGLDNDCDGMLDEGCTKTNLLFHEGNFTACNIGTPTYSGSTWQKLTFKLQFAYDQKSFLGSSHPFNPIPRGTNSPIQNDIVNVAQACKNLGSYYCDTFAATNQWDNAFKFSEIKPVDSIRAIDPLAGFAWPQNYWNASITGNATAPTFTQIQACCPGSFCWDGTTCVDSAAYINYTKLPPIFVAYGQTGYRCGANGNWSIVSLKEDYLRNDSGYCTQDSECYVGLNQPCFKSGQWGLFDSTDRFCHAGTWTTRTRYIATALLNYTDEKGINDFTLYCDVLNNALGENLDDINFDYSLNATAPKFKQFIKDSNYCQGKDCINNVCVLKFNDKVIIGTSLNAPLNTSSYPLQLIFGFKDDEYQNPIFTTGDEILVAYESPASGKLFYSKNKQVMFYSADDNVADFDMTFLESVGYVILNPITSILNYISGLFNPLQSTQIISKVNDFDRVYISVFGSRAITGLQETKVDNSQSITVEQTLLSINYTGFTNVDICTAALNKGLGCNATANSQYVYDIRSTNDAFDNVWQDLTSKLRIN